VKTVADSTAAINGRSEGLRAFLPCRYPYHPPAHHARLLDTGVGFHYAPSGSHAAEHGPWVGVCPVCATAYACRARVVEDGDSIDVEYVCLKGCDPATVEAAAVQLYDVRMMYLRLSQPENIVRHRFSEPEFRLKPNEVLRVLRMLHGVDTDLDGGENEEPATWDDWVGACVELHEAIRAAAAA
jgi:hypothetical protein